MLLGGLPGLPAMFGGMIASVVALAAWYAVDPAMTLSREGQIVWTGALLLLAFSVSTFFGLQGFGKWLSEQKQQPNMGTIAGLEGLILTVSWGQLAVVGLAILLLAA
jgi:sulfite exporter TauE/SafE